MKITPIQAEYNFTIMQHTMQAIVTHLENSRIACFYFDNKLVAEKEIELGELLTDDDYICDLVLHYCKNQVGVYADIFNNHTDKVLLTDKSVSILIDNCGFIINAFVKIEKERYSIDLKSNNSDDVFSGTFTANNFSEVLEKLRLFISTIENVSSDLATHITEISDDKVESYIKWE